MRMITQHRNHHKCNSSYGFAPDAFRVWYRLSCGPHKHLGKAHENPTNMPRTSPLRPHSISHASKDKATKSGVVQEYLYDVVFGSRWAVSRALVYNIK